MIYTEDELLFIQVMKELGLDVHEWPGEFTINGIPADEYLNEHDILDVPESKFISVNISAKELYKNELFLADSIDFVEAA